MSIIARSVEKAINEGQKSMAKHIETLVGQNNIIIENMNEIIDQQKKICDKLNIETVVEE